MPKFSLGAKICKLSKQIMRPQLHRYQKACKQPESVINIEIDRNKSLDKLPKSWNFTSHFPPDPMFPTPTASHRTPRQEIRPRTVKGALFTWVRPQEVYEPILLAVSKEAQKDLDIYDGDEYSSEFRDIVAGNRLSGWDEEKEEGGYPWAHCYGGWQFGSWAGQLGDGRAISLFELKGRNSNVQYELQLKGAGITPYSRFADGKAVLRSSIREFICSEALNALRIPSTRALSLTALPYVGVRRETLETGAIVARFAQSWLRIGTFDLLHERRERDLIRQLATYVAEVVFGGWHLLPCRKVNEDANHAVFNKAYVPKLTIEGPPGLEENRFTRLYREIVRRNAETVAKWQVYGFVNGVLNTDNTSIFGLSIDFGPFAFLDNFDPQYTPNHDDQLSRYAYCNQMSVIWWNLERLGESFAELMGIGSYVDDPEFIQKGIIPKDAGNIDARAKALIERAGEEYRDIFFHEYEKLMALRLGIKSRQEPDFKEIYEELLQIMEYFGLDFNHFFRRLSNVNLNELESESQRTAVASIFFHAEGIIDADISDADARKCIAEWLEKWSRRVREDWSPTACDSSRKVAMKCANPKFLPRSWVLDEIIRRVSKGDTDSLENILDMACDPFNDTWGISEEEKWCGDVPQSKRAMQCSCSS
ncbi:BgTH12-01039 [Blumeria graminis f. sp. triticale]|uniref:Selenoprotein O n=1 Tax=Blumeria graminis f. sp. triticale TaxID=1689686 RepID=A0A9W4D7N8_BLUGR|nr:BgTH12-01039 [Blumeria graminis f. sp. triticale]